MSRDQIVITEPLPLQRVQPIRGDQSSRFPLPNVSNKNTGIVTGRVSFRGLGRVRVARPDSRYLKTSRPDPTRPDPTRPDPTRPDPTRPDPNRDISSTS